MIIDTEKIQKLLNSDLTSYRAAQLANIRQPNYYRYQKGQTPIGNMTIKVASELMKIINLEENKMNKGIKNRLMEKVNWLESLLENAKPETPEYVILKHDYSEALGELQEELDRNVGRAEHNFKASVKRFNWEHKTSFDFEDFDFEVSPVAFMVGTGKPEGIDY